MQSSEVAYLINIVSPLVNDQGALKVEHTTDERGTLLTLSVGRFDMGRIIGKEGNTALAIRTLLRQYGGATKQVISLKINEPEGSTHKFTNRNDQ